MRLRIDGRDVVLEKPTTILNAARRVGIDVPSLCYDERLGPYGSCRLCLVNVRGRGMVTACTTMTEDGMEVETETEDVVRHRVQILQMLAERYPAEGGVQGRLGELFRRYGVTPRGAENPKLADERHPWIKVDLSRCVLCYNCVRVCEGYIGRLIWRALYRGQQALVLPETGSLATSSCISCRACVDVCPSGAIVDKVMTSSAPVTWGETACSLCSLSCPLRVGYSDGGPVYVEGRSDLLPFSARCLRGRYHWEDYVYVPERPRKPRVRSGPGAWRIASWDEAITLVSDGLRKALSDGGPSSVGVIVSSRLPAEAYYLAQLLARAGLGTNNVDAAASLLGAPIAELAPLGGPFSSIDLSRLEADAFLVVGPLEEYHPALASAIRSSSLLGLSRLVLLSSRDDKLGPAADLHVEAGSDSLPVAVQALEAAAIEEGLVDVESASKLLPGIASIVLQLRSAGVNGYARSLGLEPTALRDAARALTAGRTVIVAELDGTPGVAQESLRLAALTGALTRGGSGFVPLLSYFDNAEAGLFGVSPTRLPGLRPLSEAAELSRELGVRLPDGEGMGAAEMIEAARDGRMNALVIIGSDLASPSPMREAILEALYRVPLVVSISTVAGVGVEYTSHVHLPIASHVEEEGVYVGADGRLTLARGTRVFGGALRSWEALSRVLSAMGFSRRYSSASEVWLELTKFVPQLSGLTADSIAGGRARVNLLG
ncbi:MAG: 2Fe-2S iron-sulfur cluster-binding protein [Acidilobus sp.]